MKFGLLLWLTLHRIQEAKKMNMTALALTDYSNMYGTIEFYSTCKKEGIKPIIGAEFSIRFNDRMFHIVLLARNLIGYKNLMRITVVSQSKGLET